MSGTGQYGCLLQSGGLSGTVPDSNCRVFAGCGQQLSIVGNSEAVDGGTVAGVEGRLSVSGVDASQCPISKSDDGTGVACGEDGSASRAGRCVRCEQESEWKSLW